jgi:hypothetical protein
MIHFGARPPRGDDRRWPAIRTGCGRDFNKKRDPVDHNWVPFLVECPADSGTDERQRATPNVAVRAGLKGDCISLNRLRWS